MTKTLGVILAGGRGRRMGADKALVKLEGQCLVERAAQRLLPQVDALVISRQMGQAALPKSLANFEIIFDERADEGPASAVESAVKYAMKNGFVAVQTVPVDVPHFPHHIVAKLSTSGDLTLPQLSRVEPAFAYIPQRRYAEILMRFEEGVRKLSHLYEPFVSCHFEDERAFTNVNTPQDLKNVNS